MYDIHDMVIVLNGLAIVDFTKENLSDNPSSDDDAPVNRSASNSSNHEEMQLFNSPASLGKTVIYLRFQIDILSNHSLIPKQHTFPLVLI